MEGWQEEKGHETDSISQCARARVCVGVSVYVYQCARAPSVYVRACINLFARVRVCRLRLGERVCSASVAACTVRTAGMVRTIIIPNPSPSPSNPSGSPAICPASLHCSFSRPAGLLSRFSLRLLGHSEDFAALVLRDFEDFAPLVLG